jgi:hypothetical protein
VQKSHHVSISACAVLPNVLFRYFANMKRRQITVLRSDHYDTFLAGLRGILKIVARSWK